MTRGQAQAQCNRLNAKRDVSFHPIASPQASAFWNRCGIGRNFLVGGGSESQRADMLVDMLVDFRSRCADPVIVLTGSDLTEQAIVQAAKDKRLSKMMVSSPRYKNYHALYRMNPTQMTELLKFVARREGYTDLGRLEKYIKAFVAIANRYYPPSLAALVKLDQQYSDNDSLYALGKMSGVEQTHLNAIKSCPTGTDDLHSILEILSNTYAKISIPGCASKFNLITGVNAGLGMCIKVNSTNPDVLDMALAMELRQLIADNRRFVLILNDVRLRSAEGLYQQVLDARTGSGTSVGICTRDASAWAGTVPGVTNSAESLLQNTQNFVLFHDDSDTDSDLDHVLKYLGDYPKYEVTVGGGHGAELVPVLHHGDWHVGCVGMRNRVAPEDLKGYGVVLKGHDGRRIHLHREIKR